MIHRSTYVYFKSPRRYGVGRLEHTRFNSTHRETATVVLRNRIFPTGTRPFSAGLEGDFR